MAHLTVTFRAGILRVAHGLQVIGEEAQCLDTVGFPTSWSMALKVNTMGQGCLRHPSENKMQPYVWGLKPECPPSSLTMCVPRQACAGLC